jgi:putative peptidoglycan lipid II flippase
MSAWCLGILNSHRRFFLSYTAPVLWNLAIITTLIFYGHSSSEFDLAIKTGWGLVAGSFLQLLVQVPTTMKLLKFTTFRLALSSREVKTILKNFIPSLISRGVVQISSYVDNIFASLLASGSVSILSFAQTIYLLPISLFGTSFSASELPEMSSVTGSKEEIFKKLSDRLQLSLKRVCFFIVPSLIVFITLGDVLISALYQTGKFSQTDTKIVWLVLIGFSIGLLASTQGRLYSSVFYALKDTKTTLKLAIIRILLNSTLAYLLAFILFPKLNLPLIYHTAGLTIASGLSGWIEFQLLRRKLESVIGPIPTNFAYLIKLFSASLVAAFLGWILKVILLYSFYFHPIINAIFVFSLYGIIYFGLSAFLKIELAEQIVNKILRKLRI